MLCSLCMQVIHFFFCVRYLATQALTFSGHGWYCLKEDKQHLASSYQGSLQTNCREVLASSRTFLPLSCTACEGPVFQQLPWLFGSLLSKISLCLRFPVNLPLPRLLAVNVLRPELEALEQRKRNWAFWRKHWQQLQTNRRLRSGHGKPLFVELLWLSLNGVWVS